ncbi:MAG: RusA family crossover junction endodeoxyribonuclease [Tetragenococcus halophilus]|nr:RusA family crossover junction endodeoxyribonuclease [Tetragenococcus halophilus]
MIELIIPGEVIAKGRPKFTSRGGYARAYTPKKTKDYEALVKYYALQLKQTPLTEAIEVTISVHRVPPKSWSKKKQREALEGTILPTVKSDIDNYCKSIIDGLNGILFEDDKQICKLIATKDYSETDKAVVIIKQI